ncbi:MAG: hypothetical protein BI182_02480 [Acetobacterium sp. MES1]|uniref:Uncharacterized protein n=1 Tax=Acetobacterium wieringae TaxID=52694 RepID=A0A5D0WR32_9FIRM|nr:MULTISPECIES: hypothetical protein [Acetobacterium]OXS26593.1 MAG: hypothetical protein BI182_02480 [Acetobacterium sp. MES1]TYC86503.1 hypothetical protein FXB42_06505 [Acetobacterium wieringae]
MEVFQLKTKPHNKTKDRVNEFIQDGFVCIGWPGIDNLQNVGKDEIRTRLQQKYPNLTGHKLGNALGQVNTFVNTIQKGDIVLISEKEYAHVGIADDYYYESAFDNDDDGMCHRRKIQWVNKIKLSDLPADIQKLMANRNTICKYPKSLETAELDLLTNNTTAIVDENSQKFEELFKEALIVLEQELKSEDPDRRLKAAGELIKLKKS